MMNSYVELNGLASRLAELLDAVAADWREIQAANQTVIANGRADLKTNHPLGRLAAHLGCTVQNLPHVDLWSIHGYRPCPSEKFHLSHMRDLLPATAARKAA